MVYVKEQLPPATDLQQKEHFVGIYVAEDPFQTVIYMLVFSSLSDAGPDLSIFLNTSIY